jgi:hypothetical protein
LVKENAQLSGHRNLKQRIQFHADLKEKYHKLLEDYKSLEDQYEILSQSSKGQIPLNDMKRVLKENVNY